MALAVGLPTLDRGFERVLRGLSEPARGRKPWSKNQPVLSFLVPLALPVGSDGHVGVLDRQFVGFQSHFGARARPQRNEKIYGLRRLQHL